MKTTTAIIICLLFAAVLAGAATSFEIPIWTGKSYVWFRPGPGLTLKDGVIDVLPPAIAQRTYGAILTADSSGVYPLPAGAKNVAVWLKGLRLAVGVDYVIESGAIKPLSAWPDGLMVADFE